MHEDIEMMTPDWGKKLISIFTQNPQVGLIGVAGGGYKSLTPSSWYHYELEQNGGFYANVLQGFKRTGKEAVLDYRNPKQEDYSRVACIDGCWMCTRKSIWEEFGFEQDRLKKFHGYDMDFSLAVQQKYEVVVTFEILLKHFSEGNFDEYWFQEILKVHHKWSHLLPVNADGLIGKELLFIEKRAYRRFLQESLNKGMSKAILYKTIWHTRRSPLFGYSMMLKLVYALFKMQAGKVV